MSLDPGPFGRYRETVDEMGIYLDEKFYDHLIVSYDRLGRPDLEQITSRLVGATRKSQKDTLYFLDRYLILVQNTGERARYPWPLADIKNLLWMVLEEDEPHKFSAEDAFYCLARFSHDEPGDRFHKWWNSHQSLRNTEFYTALAFLMAYLGREPYPEASAPSLPWTRNGIRAHRDWVAMKSKDVDAFRSGQITPTVPGMTAAELDETRKRMVGAKLASPSGSRTLELWSRVSEFSRFLVESDDRPFS